MFKIRVTTLPDSGLQFNEKFSVEDINQRLKESPGHEENKIEFVNEILVNLKAERVPSGMLLQGSLKASVKQFCSLCAEQVEHVITCHIDHIFKHHDSASSSVPEDDVGISYFAGEHVELMPFIEESLILSLDPYWHPDRDKDGSCHLCKKNTDQQKSLIKIGTQPLGDLLKKAGL